MKIRSFKTKVFRFNPDLGTKPFFQEHDVPWEPGTTAMDALDYIYQNVDGTLAKYDHAACKLGICARCTGRVNGKPGLLCQIEVSDNVRIEPVSGKQIVRDLIYARTAKESEVSR